jgi:anaerobic selenocysteine-containing dehydrogenase
MSDFQYSNTAREMAVYGYDQVVRSHCRMCHGGCGVLIYMKEGKVAKIAGDPDCPINHGTLLGARSSITGPPLPTHC